MTIENFWFCFLSVILFSLFYSKHKDKKKCLECEEDIAVYPNELFKCDHCNQIMHLKCMSFIYGHDIYSIVKAGPLWGGEITANRFISTGNVVCKDCSKSISTQFEEKKCHCSQCGEEINLSKISLKKDTKYFRKKLLNEGFEKSILEELDKKELSIDMYNKNHTYYRMRIENDPEYMLSDLLDNGVWLSDLSRKVFDRKDFLDIEVKIARCDFCHEIRCRKCMRKNMKFAMSGMDILEKR